MAREIHKLTPAKIAAHKGSKSLADDGGLYFQPSAVGGSWTFRFVYRGKENYMGLGGTDMGRMAESLATARSKAEKARQDLVEGKDPLAEKRAADAAKVAAAKPKAPIFREAAQAFMEVNRPDWKSRVHKEQWRTTLERYAYPVIGDVRVDQVTVDHIRDILQPIWRTKNETARRVRGRVEMILDREAGLGHRSLADNPARVQTVRNILGKGKRRTKHHAALHYLKLSALVQKIEADKSVAALALRWLVLTATRSSEARGARWDEIDRPLRQWTIPAERMKGDEPHVVPLSDAAIAVLDELGKTPRTASPYLFVAQGDRPISDTSLRDILRDNGISKEMGSLHGMRAGFRTWAAEHGVADSVAEACLAHIVGDEVIAAYKRTTFVEMRADTMQRWAWYLADDLRWAGKHAKPLLVRRIVRPRKIKPADPAPAEHDFS